jgi:hypothetical protein
VCRPPSLPHRAQPEICRWNCEKLAEAVAWALPKKLAEQELSVFDSEYERWVEDLVHGVGGYVSLVIQSPLKVEPRKGCHQKQCLKSQV